jgi:glycosyltransferase involved in cell wall biosynthesis
LHPESVSATTSRDVGSVLFVGWLVPTKGIEELLEAWKAVDRPGRRLRLLGGYDPAYLADLTRRGLLGERVEVVGEVDHSAVLADLRRCSVFVLPSHTEGFPNVVVEAMAAGTPIIASSVGAIPDMLADGAGTVIPPRNVPAVAEAMERMLADPRAAVVLGERARLRAQTEYAIAPVVARYLVLWASRKVASTPPSAMSR